MRYVTLCLFLLITASGFSQNAPAWAQNLPCGFPNEYDAFADIETDDQGNVYTLGIRRQAAYVFHWLLTKYDLTGNLLWCDTVGDAYIFGELAILPSGSIVVAGTGAPPFPSPNSYELALYSYAPGGTQQWSLFLNGPFSPCSDLFDDMCTDSSGNIYCLSHHSHPGSGTFGYSVFKSDSSGNLLWSTHVDSASVEEYPRSISVDQQGHVYVAINTIDTSYVNDDGMLTKLSPSGQVIRNINFDLGADEFFKRVEVYNDTAIYVAGEFGSSYAQDIMLLKYDSTGSMQFLSAFSPENYLGWPQQDTPHFLNTMLVDPSGDIYLAASLFAGTWQHRWGVLKFSSSGNFQWMRSPFVGGCAEATGLDMDQSGNLFVTGRAKDTVTNYCLVGTCKMDAAGIVLWSDMYGAGNYDLPGVSVDPFGNVFVGSSDINYQVGLITLKYDQATGLQEVFPIGNTVVYPNPFFTSATFDLSGSAERIARIELFDVNGRLVRSLEGNRQTVCKLDREALRSGIYFYRIILGDGSEKRGKIIAGN